MPKRAAAILAATFFLLTTAGEGFGLHPCPYHDSLSGTPAQQQAAAGHHHHHHGSSQDQNGSTDDSGSTPCTHTNACQPPAAALVPPTLGADLVWVKQTTEEAIRPATEWLAPSLLAYFLPYSLAPPARG